MCSPVQTNYVCYVDEGPGPDVCLIMAAYVYLNTYMNTWFQRKLYFLLFEVDKV